MLDEGQLRQPVKIAIIDCRMSNLGSVSQALTVLGAQPEIVERPEQLEKASRIILPGVGSFADGMAQLHAGGWVPAIREQVNRGKPMLGICLGMQLLATSGTEGGDQPGLGLVPGEIVRLDALGCDLRIPHVGWNTVTATPNAELFRGIPDRTDFYFVHSFAFRSVPPEDVVGFTDYGGPVIAAVRHGSVVGTQFHPEKSSRAGFRLLQNFIEWQPC